MDAAAYLKSHGWRGTGHSLDHTGRGITRPLPLNRKRDLLGVGKQKLLVADQWWLRAFDSSLKELGTGKKTALQQVREVGVNRGGLYGFFVKGESLAGSIGKDIVDQPDECAESSDSTPSLSPSVDTSSIDVASLRTSTEGITSSESEDNEMASAKPAYMSRGKKRKAEAKEDRTETPKRRKDVRDKGDSAGVAKERAEKPAPAVASSQSEVPVVAPAPSSEVATADTGSDGIHPDRLARMNGAQHTDEANNGAEQPVRPNPKKERKAKQRISNEEKKMRRERKEEQKKIRRAAKKQRRQEKSVNRQETLKRQAQEKKEKLKKELAKTSGQDKSETVPKKISDGSGQDQSSGLQVKMSSEKKTKKQKRNRLEEKPNEVGFIIDEKGDESLKPKPKKEKSSKSKEKVRDDIVQPAETRAPAQKMSSDPDASSNGLSKKKKEKYAARAAEKGMTIEAYIARRTEKKENAKG